MKIRNWRILALAVVGAVALPLSACGSSSSSASGEDGKVKLGYISTLTGALSVDSKQNLEVTKAYVADINSHGGVNGQKIALDVYDTKSDPTEAARGAQKLVQDGVVAIVGPDSGSAALALAPITAPAKVPIFAMASSAGIADPKTSFFPYTFQVAMPDEVGLPAVWQKVTDAGFKRAAAFGLDDAYGQFGLKTYKSLSDKGGTLQLVGTVTATADASDFSAQALKIKQSNPDVVIVQVSAPQVIAPFLQALSNVGVKVPVYGGLGFSSASLLPVLGAYGPGGTSLNLYNPGSPTAQQQALAEIATKAGVDKPDGYKHMMGANAVAAIVAAIKAGGSATGPAIQKAVNGGLTVDAFAPTPYKFTSSNHSGLTGDSVVWTRLTADGFVKED